MCLGPDGFGFCDAKSLWILAYTHPTKKTKAIVSMLSPEPEKMCLGSSSGGWFSSLRPVGVSKCVAGAGKGLGCTYIRGLDFSFTKLVESGLVV